MSATCTTGDAYDITTGHIHNEPVIADPGGYMGRGGQTHPPSIGQQEYMDTTTQPSPISMTQMHQGMSVCLSCGVYSALQSGCLLCGMYVLVK